MGRLLGAVLAVAAFSLWRFIQRYFSAGLDDLFWRVLVFGILTMLSYPVLFAVDRGNMDIIVFTVLLWFIMCYMQGRLVLAVVLVGVAVAMKLYPAPLLLLFFCDRRWRWGGAAIAWTALVTVAATLLLSVSARLPVMTVVSHVWETLVGGHVQYGTIGFSAMCSMGTVCGARSLFCGISQAGTTRHVPRSFRTPPRLFWPAFFAFRWCSCSGRDRRGPGMERRRNPDHTGRGRRSDLASPSRPTTTGFCVYLPLGFLVATGRRQGVL